MPDDTSKNGRNGYFRGHTAATEAGMAKALDNIQDRLHEMPCAVQAKSLASLKLQGYARWFLIAGIMGSLAWLYQQLIVLTRQVATLTEQTRALAETVARLMVGK